MKRKWIVLSTTVLVVMSLLSGSFALPLAIGTDGGQSPEERLSFLIDYIADGYYKEIDEDALYESAYKALFESLDEHSVYYNQEELEGFNVDSTGTYGGIGVQVTMENGYVTVIAPFDGTPGDRAGILPGDQVIVVDGENVEGQPLDIVAGKMRGEPGEVLKMEIRRKGTEGTIPMEIVREVITVHPVTYEVLEGEIGYLRLSTFNEHAFKDVAVTLSENGDRPLVIDLRNNPGGYLDQVIKMADLFLEKGAPIMKVDYRTRMDQAYRSTANPVFDGKMVVLINEGSASASEILAGALKANDRATIMGTTSYGKGTVQSLMELSDGNGVKMTIAEYLVGEDTPIDGVGVTPHVEATADGDLVASVEELQPFLMEQPLKRGDLGIDVYAAQERLSLMGYTIAIDGVFGRETDRILRAFQKEAGITEDGILEDETERALNTALREKMADQVLRQAVETLK